jgi:hypothetical protein
MTGYPVVVPDVIMDRLQKIFIDPGKVLGRPAPLWNGKSAIQAVADGDRTWEQVLSEYERIVSWEYLG